MEKAREMGAGALAITGNIDFYGKSGFVPAKTRGVRYADDPDAMASAESSWEMIPMDTVTFSAVNP